jgi:hypothetical protein
LDCLGRVRGGALFRSFSCRRVATAALLELPAAILKSFFPPFCTDETSLTISDVGMMAFFILLMAVIEFECKN